MFTLKVHVLSMSHHVFTLDSYCTLVVILDMCLMPLAVCALWLFLILTFGVSRSDKLLWLEGYL